MKPFCNYSLPMSSTTRGFIESTLYALIRLSPALAALLVIELPSDSSQATLIIGRLLILFIILVTWNMTEGTLMLWLKAKQAGKAQARGYAIVAAIFGVCVLLLFQFFRIRASQELFILLLAALSLRGMSRAGWEQGRPQVAIITTFVGHTLTALLSLLCCFSELSWPMATFALAIGAAVSAVEMTWNTVKLTGPGAVRWVPALFRVSLVLGPLLVATMALLGQLSPHYVLVYATLFLVIPILRGLAKRGAGIPHSLRGVAGVYLLFVAIMIGCRLYISNSN